jgi:hypothetical protein
MTRADFSIRPLGSTSTLISTRVSRGASSWNVATPWCVMPSVTCHSMPSSGRCSSISAARASVARVARARGRRRRRIRLGGGDADPASTEEEKVEVVRERLLEGVLLERPRGGRELALFEQRVN